MNCLCWTWCCCVDTIYVTPRYYWSYTKHAICTCHIDGFIIISQSSVRAVNSLTPGRCGGNCKSIIFKFMIQNNGLSTHGEIVRQWMPETHTKWTLIQVMAWCHHSTSYYLSQCFGDLCCHMEWLSHSELMTLNDNSDLQFPFMAYFKTQFSIVNKFEIRFKLGSSNDLLLVW